MQPTMSSFTLKSIPDHVLDQLRAEAQLHRRSLNSEMLYRLEQSLGPTAVEPEAFLQRVRALRAQTALPPLTEDLLRQADEGRP